LLGALEALGVTMQEDYQLHILCAEPEYLLALKVPLSTLCEIRSYEVEIMDENINDCDLRIEETDSGGTSREFWLEDST
jgi:hypothetical protein